MAFDDSQLLDGPVYQALAGHVQETARLRNADSRTTLKLEGILCDMDSAPLLVKIANSHQYRERLCSIMLDMEGFTASEAMTRILEEDEIAISGYLQFILHNDTMKKQVLALEGEHARGFLDLLQNIIDKLEPFAYDEVNHISEDGLVPSYDDRRSFRRRLVRLAIRLAEKCGMLPSALFVQGVEYTNGRDPERGGAFADIFLGVYEGTPVALKRLRVFQADHDREEIHEKFHREAITWRLLRHPNVLPFYGVDEVTFSPFLTMVSPWMTNGTVIDYLKRCHPPSQAVVDRLLVEIARGLSYLHSQDVVHGDLRGANILVDAQGHARLADFGLAIVFSTTASLRTLGTSGGNSRWLAPELLDPELIEQIGFRRTPESDVYSFACVCLELHTKKAPFYHLALDASVLIQILSGKRPPRPTKEECFGLTISENLWDLMSRCWVAQPTKRPKLDLIAAELKNEQNIQDKPRKPSLTEFDLYKKQAEAQEVEVRRLASERERAVQEKRVWDAFVLKVQKDEAEARLDELNEKADEAYWNARNDLANSTELDVQHLRTPDAIKRVERAVYNNIVEQGPTTMRVKVSRKSSVHNGRLPPQKSL